MTVQNVRVGVGCFVFNDKGEYLVFKRQGSHGHGTWSLAGGHQEWFETPAETAARETMEEGGVMVDPADMVPLGFTNDIMRDDNKHYITLFMACRLPVGQVPQNREPHKATAMEWWDGADSRTLFSPLQNFLHQEGDPYELFLQKVEAVKAAVAA